MSKDYFNDEEYSEQQNIIKQVEISRRFGDMEVKTDSIFIALINWLARDKDWSGSEICSIVEKPHHYKKEYEQFITEYWEKL